MENCLRSKRTLTPHKIKVNKCKLIDLVIRIELTLSNFNAKIIKFSEKFHNPFLYFFIFGNMFFESHGFIVMPVTRIKNTCYNLFLSN